MASIEQELDFAGKTPKELYQAALAAYPQAGFNIWKTRVLACLVIANTSSGDATITSNFIARYNAPVALSMSSEELDRNTLKSYAEKFISEMHVVLDS
ncbi:MAG TPA: hypothetical protein G4N92_06510 [Anaerolineae bacterium]|nr:hypothetical protein [Anaerolineae bacterium]